ncbi:MAG: FHA domain-containing protein [Rhodocyclaceae bacterium]|nr:FHA domain-containing protein [Rhodocyclaceae bacterium]MDZ4216671.1 FHA domain-containing protein [Rhodocyclaceae bacterium]
MAKLILSMDNLVLKEIPLNKERTTLGRKASNDIQIDNLAISGEHAVIVTILNDSFLEDLNSTNGTFVNGQQIKKHFLQNNDVVELGKYRLKYVNEAALQASQADFEKTMVLRPDMMRKAAEQAAGKPADLAPPIAAAVPKPAPAPAAADAVPLGAIQVLNGSNAGKTMELVKSLTTLGKPGVQVAVIARRPHGYFLTHVEGAKFPSINGTQIDTQAHELKDHDVIELAGVKMEFFLKR